MKHVRILYYSEWVPILSQMHPVHAFPPYVSNNHFNIIPIYVCVFRVVSSLQVLR